MTLPELAATLDTRRISLTARLVVDAPAGVMTPELRAALEKHKPRLLLALAQELLWNELARQRWSNQRADPTPDIDIVKPNRERQRAALEAMDRTP
jgi:hypothetical protein